VRSGAREYIIAMYNSGVLVLNAFPFPQVVSAPTCASRSHQVLSLTPSLSILVVGKTEDARKLNDRVPRKKSNYVICSAYSVPGHRGVSPCGRFSNLIYKIRTGGNTCQCHSNMFGIDSDAKVFAF